MKKVKQQNIGDFLYIVFFGLLFNGDDNISSITSCFSTIFFATFFVYLVVFSAVNYKIRFLIYFSLMGALIIIPIT